MTITTSPLVLSDGAPAPSRPRESSAAGGRSFPVRAGVMNNRPVYLAWGAAWFAGYGLLAVGPGLGLPDLLGRIVLITGLLAATAVTIVETVRGQRGATGPAKLAGTMFGIAWATGFSALFLLITAVAARQDDASLQTLLWPTGSAVVVGLMYLMGGALQRDLVQYALGTWLALVGAAAMFTDLGAHYAVLVVAGVPAYLIAAVLDGPRRTAALRAAHTSV